MGNFQQDWGAMDSLLDDTGDAADSDLDEQAKRGVQLMCCSKASTKEEAEEFMRMLGVHPADTPLDIPPGPPLPSPHLRLNSTPPRRLSPQPLNQNVARSRR